MQDTSLEYLVDLTTSKIESRYGRAPDWIVAAPGRVNLIGEHVDYNDGIVIPMAIERRIVIAACANPDDTSVASIYSLELQQAYDLDLSSLIEPAHGKWNSYVEGVIACFLRRGHCVPGFQAVIGSSIPVGSGLSSSAALEVATATLLEAMTGIQLSGKEKAVLCQQAEHEFAGVPCGIMDQSCSVLGEEDHLMLLDCRSGEIDPLLFDDPGVTVLIADSRVRHELGNSEYATRRRECTDAAVRLGLISLRDATAETIATGIELGPTISKRVRHVVTEIDRSRRFSESIYKRDWRQAGQRMYESHVSLRDDFEVSCTELNLLVEIAESIGVAGGVYGSRMTGGGFGGCTVSLVKTECVDSITDFLIARFRAETGIEPTVFSSRPAIGARIIAPAPTERHRAQS